MPSFPKWLVTECRRFIFCAANDHEEMRERADPLLAKIDAALKTKRSVTLSRKRVAKKKATKRDETAAIRQAVFARAGGLCEMCGGTATDLEHIFGRVRVKQSAANCAALCRGCHVERTNSRPSAFHWWALYRELFLHRKEPGLARLCEQKMDRALSAASASRVSPSLEETNR